MRASPPPWFTLFVLACGPAAPGEDVDTDTPDTDVAETDDTDTTPEETGEPDGDSADTDDTDAADTDPPPFTDTFFRGRRGVAFVADTSEDSDTGVFPFPLDTAIPVDTDGALLAGPGAGRACPGGVAAYVGLSTFGSVTEALDASAPGDTVVICPGTWRVNWTMTHAGPLEIVANDLNPATTRLDGGRVGPILSLPSGTATRIDGLGFVRGAARSGGAISAGQVNRLAVRGCRFIGNLAGYDGGAIRAFVAAPVLSPAPIRIEDSVFLGNRAGYEAGAVSIGVPFTAPRVQLTRSVLSGNGAGYAAGALKLSGTGGRYLIEDVDLLDNLSVRAAAMDLAGAPVVEMSGGRIVRNLGSALGAVEPGDGVLTLTNVDLGAGADDNTPSDVQGCTGSYGAGSSFTYDADQGLLCQ